MSSENTTYFSNWQPIQETGLKNIKSSLRFQNSQSATKKAREYRAKASYRDLTLKDVVVGRATANLEREIKITKQKVNRIVKECRQLNRKFRDREFSLEDDPFGALFWNFQHHNGYLPDGKHLYIQRIPDFFTNPVFLTNGICSGDVMQGRIGDCWVLSSVSTCSNIRGLIERLCVARDEQVGVYGFVFFKDGDWISTIVDDQLFCWNEPLVPGRPELFSAYCKNENETWLPLLEKAFAKVHGDYESIDGGLTGQGLEDLTGGVYTSYNLKDILDKDRFWREELSQVNVDRLYGAERYGFGENQLGLLDSHAYSFLRAVEINGTRLVQIRNPLGRTEWKGPWSDGSEEWTPEWMMALDYRFGNDGTFWMAYEDLQKFFTQLGKCRIFDQSWNEHSVWINYNVVPKSNGQFKISLSEAAKVIIALQQPDQRYFHRVQTYNYSLSFRVFVEGSQTYLIRSPWIVNSLDNRSVNLEILLEPGNYAIIPRILRNKVPQPAPTPPEPHEKNFSPLEIVPKVTEPNLAEEAIKQKRIGNLFQGRDANDDGYEEDDQRNHSIEKNEPWELILGLRVYTQSNGLTLTSYEGFYPVTPMFGAYTEEEEEEDPEA
ncbi:hypothetical protein G9A89_001562 [Geosiphon pyriformis]|nr:hypothetical protein G9A89_001562 [Geosiphon pyriformis]